jgi:Domain of unknown function (DUF3885)
MNYPEWIATRFPGLTLGAALLYRWPVGIRFELDDQSHREPDFTGIANRATSIFREAFQAEDSMVAVSLKEPVEALTPIRSGESTGLFEFIAEHFPNSTVQTESASMETEDGIATLQWAALPSSIEVGAIFRAIGNIDFARLPKITDRVFLLNVSRDVILHMYDDRGLDVIAANPTSLLALYKSHNAWILEYDRARIDAIFEG